MNLQSLQGLKQQLLTWYDKNHRPLPWRKTRDPYRIWISEIMLQQTTVTAAAPYYEKFLQHFPNLETLAKATQEQVYAQWAGLGYYSRARNILKAAKILANLPNFPCVYKELLKLPGIGNYTSRAISAFAFGEEVGALDTNVIRVLSRVFNSDTPPWTTAGRQILQAYADEIVRNGPAFEANQALIELGATLCTAKNPQCLPCPWNNDCESLKNHTIMQRPLQRKPKAITLCLWKPYKQNWSKPITLVNTHEYPFLKGQWVLPGEFQTITQKPKKSLQTHSITHYRIYVQRSDTPLPLLQSSKRVTTEQLSQISPFSFTLKTVDALKKNRMQV